MYPHGQWAAANTTPIEPHPSPTADSTCPSDDRSDPTDRDPSSSTNTTHPKRARRSTPPARRSTTSTSPHTPHTPIALAVADDADTNADTPTPTPWPSATPTTTAPIHPRTSTSPHIDAPFHPTTSCRLRTSTPHTAPTVTAHRTTTHTVPTTTTHTLDNADSIDPSSVRASCPQQYIHLFPPSLHNPWLAVPGKYQDYGHWCKNVFGRWVLLNQKAVVISVEHQSSPEQRMYGNGSLLHPRNSTLRFFAPLSPLYFRLFACTIWGIH